MILRRQILTDFFCLKKKTIFTRHYGNEWWRGVLIEERSNPGNYIIAQ